VTEICSHLLPEHLHNTVNRIELPLNRHSLSWGIPGANGPRILTPWEMAVSP